MTVHIEKRDHGPEYVGRFGKRLLLVDVRNPSDGRIELRGIALAAGDVDFDTEFFAIEPSGTTSVSGIDPYQSFTFVYGQEVIRAELRGAGLGDETTLRAVCTDALGRRFESNGFRLDPPPPSLTAPSIEGSRS